MHNIMNNFYGWFTLADLDTDSDLDFKPNDLYYVEIFMLHRVKFRFQSQLLGIRIGIRIGIWICESK